MKLLDLFLGRRLANREGGEQKIGWVAAVPAMGLDGLGSSSYGPEAALTILALLAVLYFSYRQTIVAYPHNGGVYTVAKENLGTGAALLAVAALMIDYVLNVAVGISAGVGALTSSFPALHSYSRSSRSPIFAARARLAGCSRCRPTCSSPASSG